jgi:hypothetical protein
MTIPTSGSFSSETIRSEWGGSYPMTSSTVSSWAGLGTPWTSEQLRGKSASTLTITVGARTQTRVGGSASTRFKAAQKLTAVYSGFTASTFAWSYTSNTLAAAITATTVNPTEVWLTYDVFEGDEYTDYGTVYLTITDTNGQPHSASASYSL